MIEATIYNTQTGIIRMSFSGMESDIPLQLNENESYIEGWFEPAKYYVEDSMARESLPATLNLPTTIDVGQELSFNVPEKSVAIINGQSHTGAVTLSSDVPKNFMIVISGQYTGQYLVKVFSYVENRVAAYPTYGEQFDYIYHNGYEAWYQMITDIKNQYPKPS